MTMRKMFLNATMAAFFIGLLSETFRWAVDLPRPYEGLIGVVVVTMAVFFARNFMKPF